jgi:hypothetical protein
MLDYAALARENLFVGVVALAVVLTATYAIFRSVKARNKRRRAAWRAERAEQDRIWNERIGHG